MLDDDYETAELAKDILEMLLFVEAAGGLRTADDLGLLDSYPDESIDVLYELTPRVYGGLAGGPMAEVDYQRIIDDVYETFGIERIEHARRILDEAIAKQREPEKQAG